MPLARLTPPDAMLAALLDGVAPAMPRRVPVAAALGRVLAEDLRASAPVPMQDIARHEGWAVAAADTLGASPYAPVPLAQPPRLLRSGDPLPPGTDALLGPFDIEEGPLPQALHAAAPGEGIRRAGEDLGASADLARAGHRLRPQDLPALLACGFTQLALRIPRVALLDAGTGLGPMLAALATAEGADTVLHAMHPDALAASAGCDAMLLLGGIDEAADDPAPRAIAKVGTLLARGLAARPGRATAIGRLRTTPVLLLPGRAEDALAAWLLLGRPLLRHLAGAALLPGAQARLTRKVASTIGLAELVPLRCPEAGVAEPLAVGALPLGALRQADAILVVPPAAEGYEAGSMIACESL
jgi:molybdopterin biosynthesis enzyme